MIKKIILLVQSEALFVYLLIAFSAKIRKCMYWAIFYHSKPKEMIHALSVELQRRLDFPLNLLSLTRIKCILLENFETHRHKKHDRYTLSFVIRKIIDESRL